MLTLLEYTCKLVLIVKICPQFLYPFSEGGMNQYIVIKKQCQMHFYLEGNRGR
jgi:hypothetical protein